MLVSHTLVVRMDGDRRAAMSFSCLTLILRRLQLTQLDGSRRPLAFSVIAGVMYEHIQQTRRAESAQSQL